MVCWWNRSHGYFQDYKVCDRWGLVNGIWGGPWEWRFQLRDRALNDLSSLIDLIGNLSLSRDGIDSRSWFYEVSDMFKVKTFSECIQNSHFSDCGLGKNHVWNSWIPRKVNIFVGRVSFDRLVTRHNLFACGVAISDHSCPFCDSVNRVVFIVSVTGPLYLSLWGKIEVCGTSILNLSSTFFHQNVAMGNICNLGCARLS
ncbi:RNA-directed DNA polymerase, eukaryota, reverse transcriptase zinc-binding domain protein [Tanacetum coccineum]